MLLQPGQRFLNRYLVVRPLAQGGMGEVFVAKDLVTEWEVALKVFGAEQDSLRQNKSFELEAKVSGMARTQHLVKVENAGFDEASGLAFLVMELLEGLSLEALIKREGALPAERVVRYITEAARGIDKAHNIVKDGERICVLHRDLKPDNLFLSEGDGRESIVKVLDFGIARVMTGTSGASQPFLTPLYAAYEQYTRAPLTRATDVWPLGLIAFYLLTGRVYWKAEAAPALLAEITQDARVRPSERAREVGVEAPWGAAFDEWFLTVVNNNFLRRPQSAGEAAEMLRSALLAPASPLELRDAAGAITNTAQSPKEPSSAAEAADPVSPRANESTEGALAATHRTLARGRTATVVGVASLVGVLGIAVFVAKRSPAPAPARSSVVSQSEERAKAAFAAVGEAPNQESAMAAASNDGAGGRTAAAAAELPVETADPRRIHSETKASTGASFVDDQANGKTAASVHWAPLASASNTATAAPDRPPSAASHALAAPAAPIPSGSSAPGVASPATERPPSAVTRDRAMRPVDEELRVPWGR